MYGVFASTFDFNGKPVFKKIKSPQDIYYLPGDKKTELEGDKAEEFMKSIAKK